MRRYFIIVLVTLFTYPSNGQDYIPFPTSDVTWCTGEYFSIGWPQDTTYYYYKTNGDTIINDKSYTILEMPDRDQYGFFRDDNEKVYFKYAEDIPEFVLYDFTLNAGDTVLLPNTFDGQLMFYDGYVDYCDSLLIGNKYHRRINITSWIGLEIIEGIGAQQGLLYCELPWVDWYGFLECFSLKDTIFHTDGSGSFETGNCWETVEIEETHTNSLKIYPNPACDVLNICGIGNYRIELYSLGGERILTTDNQAVDLDRLKPGIYLLRILSTNDGFTKCEKVVITDNCR